MRKTLVGFSTVFLVYWLVLAAIGGRSNVCFYSGPDPDNQPFLAYGFPLDPAYGFIYDYVFAPITAGFDKTKIVRDPGDFSGSSGQRLGVFSVLLCLTTNYGRFLIAVLLCCIVFIGHAVYSWSAKLVTTLNVTPDCG